GVSPALVALDPLVAGLPADPIPLTQLGHGEAVGECVEHEPGSLIHGAGLTPGHRAIPPKGSALVCSKCYLCARSNLLPMSPVCTGRGLTPEGKLQATPAPSRVNCDTSSFQHPRVEQSACQLHRFR